MNLTFSLSLALVLSVNCYAAIIFPAAPGEGRQIACAELSRVLQGFTNATGGLQMTELTIADAHKTYSVGPTDMVSGNLLASAEFAGWVYPFVHGTNAVCEVPLTIDPQGAKWVPAGGVFLDYDNRLLEGIQKAEKLPQVKKHDYEFRDLRMATSFSAIWLHGKSGDIIIPLPPTYGPWKAYQPYSEEQITRLLKSGAGNRLKQPTGVPDLQMP